MSHILIFRCFVLSYIKICNKSPDICWLTNVEIVDEDKRESAVKDDKISDTEKAPSVGYSNGLKEFETSMNQTATLCEKGEGTFS